MANASHDSNGRPTVILASENDGVTIVPLQADPVGHGLVYEDNTTGSDNGNNGGSAIVDDNSVSVWTALSSTDGATVIEVYGDPSNGAILIDSM